MDTIIHAIAGLAPDTQLILAMSIFTIIVVIAVSSGTGRNGFVDALCKVIGALAHLFRPERKPPKDPPIQDAA